MPTNIILPSLGFDMTEGRVAAWLAAEGDPVEKGKPVVEVETEKATVEVDSPATGVLARVAVPAGATVPVGTVIGIVAEAGEKPADAPGAGEAAAKAAPPAEPAEAAPPAAASGPAPDGGVRASPLARRMAEEAGLDLSAIRGSGPDGRIMERDVRAAIAAKERSAAAPPAAAAPQGAPPAAPSGGGAVPLSRMRQAIARRMAESKATAPHFYATVEIRMDAAQRLRHSLNGGGGDDGPVTGNDLVVAACARALREVPALNASWRDGSVVVHPEVGIGIAVALEGGLVTPVVHGADRLGLRDLSAATHGAVERARAGRLRPEDLSGGTFTVSNMSMLGVDEFIAIINPPEAAILAVGAVVRRPVADGDAIRIARVMKATLSVDHRVADGATAARFLQVLRELLEKPDPLAGGDPSAEAR